MARIRRTLIASFVVLQLLFAGAPYAGFDVAPSARADAVLVVAQELPSARPGTSAVWTGTEAYVFGGGEGRSGVHNQVVRFVPGANGTSVVAQLPSGRADTAAVWTGSAALVFGGVDGAGYLDEVLRFDPATGQVTTQAAKLPVEMAGLSAVWTGSVAYLFGGWGLEGPSDLILRYDPASDTLSMVNAQLPGARAYAAAVWGGEKAYLFGGRSGGSSGYLDEILAFDPAAGTVTVRGAMPYARQGASAVWTGREALVFGGLGPASNQATDQILVFHPDQATAFPMAALLPTARSHASAVWDGAYAWVFGGKTSGFGFALRQIVRYDPMLHGVGGGHHAPVAAIAPVAPRECVDGGAVVTLDGRPSTDADGDVLGYSWSAPGLVFDDHHEATPTAFFRLGETPVTLVVSDGAHRSSASAVVVVQDTLPPTVRITRPLGDTYYVNDAPVVTHYQGALLPDVTAVGRLSVIADADDLCGVRYVGFRGNTTARVGAEIEAEALGLGDSTGGAVTLGTYRVNAQVSRAPYTVRVDPTVRTTGLTTLTATAVDLAGNTAEERRSWTHLGTRPSTSTQEAETVLPGDLLEESVSGAVGAHIHSRWLAPGSPLDALQVAALAEQEQLQVVSFGVPMAKPSAAPALAKAFLTALGTTPTVPQFNTFGLAPAQQTPEGLERFFARVAPALEGQGNVVIVGGGNEPLTASKGWATAAEAAARVRAEYAAWHAVSDLPFCHKFTDPAIDAPGTDWALLEELWAGSQDAICYNWYHSTGDTAALVQRLHDLGQRLGKPVYVLEAAVPKNDPAMLRELASKVDAFVVYQLVATKGGEDEHLAAWVLEDGQLLARPPAVMLRSVLRPDAPVQPGDAALPLPLPPEPMLATVGGLPALKRQPRTTRPRALPRRNRLVRA